MRKKRQDVEVQFHLTNSDKVNNLMFSFVDGALEHLLEHSFDEQIELCRSVVGIFVQKKYPHLGTALNEGYDYVIDSITLI